MRRNLPTTIHGLNSLEKQLQCSRIWPDTTTELQVQKIAADQKSRQAAAAGLVALRWSDARFCWKAQRWRQRLDLNPWRFQLDYQPKVLWLRTHQILEKKE